MKRTIYFFISLILTLIIPIQTFASNENSSKILTFNEYLADYNYKYNSYNFYKNLYKSPYRSIVETRKDSEEWQTLLFSWRVATFKLSDIIEYNSKEVGFYETILFDILYQGNDLESLSGMLKSCVDTVQSSILGKIVKAFSSENKTTIENNNLNLINQEDFLKKNIKKLSKTEIDKLNKQIQTCDELSEVFKAIGNISNLLGYVNNIEELIYKLAKTQVIIETSNESIKILNDMKNKTTNKALKNAIEGITLAYSKNLSQEFIIYVFSTEMMIEETLKYLLDTLWSDILASLGLSYLEIGQAVGKLFSNLLFSTDENIEMYYTACALYEFEDILKEILSSYELDYINYKTYYNSTKFNECYKLLLKTHLLGIKFTQKFLDLEYKEGNINKILLNFKNSEYEKYSNSLDNIAKNMEASLIFMDVVAYNSYLDEYCQKTADIIGIEKKEDIYTNEQKSEILQTLELLSYQTNNIVITQDMTLTQDIHTYGSIYHKGGVLNLNGHTLEIDGNYVMAGEKTFDDNGEETYQGTPLAYLNMTQNSDKMIVNGDFEIYGLDNTGNLTAGVLELKGNFSQHSYGSSRNFNATGKHKVIFNGNDIQTIYFDSTDSGFKNVDFLNNNIKILSPIRGISLNQDLTLSETTELNISDELDLNGHTLTFPQNLWHKSGTIKFNGGTLNVLGDYIMAGEKFFDDNGEEKYSGASLAYLNMTQSSDKMIVNGDFKIYGPTHTGKLTAGTIVLKGNFEQHSYFSTFSFNCTGKHNVIFNGNDIQTIYFESPNSNFRNLEIQNKTGPIILLTTTKITDTLTHSSNIEIQNINTNLLLEGKQIFETKKEVISDKENSTFSEKQTSSDIEPSTENTISNEDDVTEYTDNENESLDNNIYESHKKNEILNKVLEKIKEFTEFFRDIFKK